MIALLLLYCERTGGRGGAEGGVGGFGGIYHTDELS